LDAYEVSNHAAPGDESRHNLIYWRYGDYLGVGPGAHGRLRLADGTRIGTSTLKDPAAWLSCVEKAGHGQEVQDVLGSHEQAEEMLLMGLRLSEGLSLERLRAVTGHDVTTEVLADLQSLGLITCGDDRLWLTGEGRLLLNQVALKMAGGLAPLAPRRAPGAGGAGAGGAGGADRRRVPARPHPRGAGIPGGAAGHGQGAGPGGGAVTGATSRLRGRG